MKQIYSIPSGRALLLWLLVIYTLPIKAQISQEVCQTVLPDRTYEQMRREASIIQYTHNEVRGRGEAASTDTIPVFFTVFRNDDGSFADPAIDAALADEALEQLNQYFAPIRLVFVRLGKINYIDNTAFGDFSRHHHLARFSYLSTALNVYSKSGSSSFAQFPSLIGPVDEFEPGSSNGDRSNMISLNSHHFLTSSFAHELGHSYGLLHTFEGAQVYNNPVAPTPGYSGSFPDHPYGEGGNIRRRELVIRQPDDHKPFASPNSSTAGDFVDDTPAFCVSTHSYPDYYPKLQADQCESYPFDRSQCNGCIVVDCNYEGDYVDYNGDTLINTEVSIRNLMSYTSCRSEFTPGQYERMSFYHEQVRKHQYDQQQGINFSDTVFFEDTRIPMDDILVQLTHPGQNRYCNTTTNTAGAFQGILYEPWVSARLLKAGTGLDTDYRTSPWVEPGTEEIIAHSYRESDWQLGVDERDLELLQQHLAGEKTLNGYHQLAADLNADGQLTETDARLLEQLIRGELRQLEHHPSPWRFLPAYIPEQHPAGFHENPFNMEIAGITYQRYAPYLDHDWLYNAESLPAQLRGFTGIKLADLDGSSMGLPPNTDEPEIVIESDPDVPQQPATDHQPHYEISKINCFPNPTAGKLTINFDTKYGSQASLRITDGFYRSFYEEEIELEYGRNEFVIADEALPRGLLIVTLKTPDGIFYEKVVKQ